MRKTVTLLSSALIAGSALVAAAGVPGGNRKAAARDITAPADFSKRVTVKHRAKTLGGAASSRQLLPDGFHTSAPGQFAKRLAKAPAVAVPKKAPARSAAITDGITLRASMVSTWSFMRFPGLYNVPTTADGVFEEVGPNIIVEYGAYDDGAGNFYLPGVTDWGMGFTIPYLSVYDSTTWEYKYDVESADGSIMCTDNAVDPTSGRVYGCYHDAETGDLVWGIGDYTTGTSTAIRPLGEDEKMWGVACDGDGNFYAVLENGNLVTVDKATGTLTTVGDTGLRPFYTTGATFDTKANRILFAYCPVAGTGALWSIDPATAAAEPVVEYPDNDQLTYLNVIMGADPLSPAAPALSVAAPNGSLTATYTLTMPSANIDGSEAEATMSYTLMLDGEKVAEGTAAKGAEVTGTVDVASEGMHSFVAQATNSVGTGERTKVEMFIGMGQPAAPASASCTVMADGSVAIAWEAVTTSADGGYVAPESITYTLRRNGDVVAEGLTATSYTDTPPAGEGYRKLTYTVEAVNGTKSSATAECVAGVGAMTPPYECKFGTAESDHEFYSSFNLNNDNSNWYYTPYYKCFKVDYSDEHPNDDWLLTPAFHLEAGKSYEFSYRIFAGSEQYAEHYSLHMGTQASPAAMTTVLIADEELTNSPETPLVKTVTITPEATGNYFIGWHAVSAPPCFMIRLDNIAMSAPLSAASPAEVTAVALTPDADGHLTLTGAFTAPTVTVTGEPLASACRVIITRNGKATPVAEFAAEPGARLTFTDTDFTEAGTYTYEFRTENLAGDFGRSVKASTYVGPVAPKGVTNIAVTETETPGTVRLTWTAPTLNVDEKPLNAANLTYMVYALNGNKEAIEMLAEPTSACEAVVKVCEPSEAKFAILYVEARNLGLESKELPRCPMIPVGRTAALPYNQSYTAADRAANITGIYAPDGSGAMWGVGNHADTGIAAQDGDDAFLHLFCTTQYAQPAFYTGKINLEGAENPALSFYHYVISGSDANSFTVEVVTADGTPHQLADISHISAPAEGWNLAHFPLNEFKGQTIYVVVRTTVNTHYDMAFDHLRITDLPAVDLAATAIAAPSKVKLDTPYDIAVTVANLGYSTATSYTVALMVNGKVVDSMVSTNEILPGGETVVEFLHTLSPLTLEAPEFTASVTIDGDADRANDCTLAAVPELQLPRWPSVADLDAANAGDNRVALRWSAPATAGFDAKEVEDFEDATPWADEVEGWTLVDRDRQQIGALDAVGVPEAVDKRTYHSFFVFDNNDENIFFYNPALQPLFNAHSGNRCMAAMYIFNMGAQQDDWAISPTLTGEAQTVSFYARSYHPDYLDKMEVLYATDDTTDPDAFITLCPDGPIEVPQKVNAYGAADYTLYEFALPEGAKRFAIRCCNNGYDGYMLMFDDVKMRVANATLEIAGYDIYRDGLKLNDAPVAATTYTDTPVAAGQHTYNVTVRYNRGISSTSNTATVEATGASGIGAATAAGASITAKGLTIRVAGIAADAPVMIATPDGRTVYSADGPCAVSLPAGIYIATTPTLTAKVTLR